LLFLLCPGGFLADFFFRAFGVTFLVLMAVNCHAQDPFQEPTEVGACNIKMGQTFQVFNSFQERLDELKGTYKDLISYAASINIDKKPTVRELNEIVMRKTAAANAVLDLALDLDIRIGTLNQLKDQLPSDINFDVEMAKLNGYGKEIEEVFNSSGVQQKVLQEALQLRIKQFTEKINEMNKGPEKPKIPIGFVTNTSSTGEKKVAVENPQETIHALLSPLAETHRAIGFLEPTKPLDHPSRPVTIGFITPPKKETDQKPHLISPVTVSGFQNTENNPQLLVMIVSDSGEFFAIPQKPTHELPMGFKSSK